MPLESNSASGDSFKCFKTTMRFEDDAQSTNTRRTAREKWWIDMVYLETICGVAQIIRDPSIPQSTEYTFNQVYFSLPSPAGGFSVADDVFRLHGPSPSERNLVGVFNDLMSEI